MMVTYRAQFAWSLNPTVNRTNSSPQPVHLDELNTHDGWHIYKAQHHYMIGAVESFVISSVTCSGPGHSSVCHWGLPPPQGPRMTHDWIMKLEGMFHGGFIVMMIYMDETFRI